MSDSPLGPWQFKGLIMEEHDNRCWTNHHSLVEYKGQWYLFYHRNHYSPNMDKRRSACIEKVSFNADGTIQEVKQTLRGVGITHATDRIEIDRYSSVSDGVTTDFNDTTSTFNGWHATLEKKGSWLRYNDVDFAGISDSYVVVKAKANTNTSFTIRDKSEKGKVMAKLTITVEGETGLRCKVGDVDSLYECMRHFHDHRELATQMGEAARKRVNERFSAQLLTQYWVAFYHSLLKVRQ